MQAGAAACHAVIRSRLQQPAVVREQAVARAQEGEIGVARLGHPEAKLRLPACLSYIAGRLGDNLLQVSLINENEGYQGNVLV